MNKASKLIKIKSHLHREKMKNKRNNNQDHYNQENMKKVKETSKNKSRILKIKFECFKNKKKD